MAHPLFDELRTEGSRLPSRAPLPPLLNFTREELSARPDLIPRLVPAWAEDELLSRGVDVHNFGPSPARPTLSFLLARSQSR